MNSLFHLCSKNYLRALVALGVLALLAWALFPALTHGALPSGSYTSESMQDAYEATVPFEEALRDAAAVQGVSYEEVRAVAMKECGGCRSPRYHLGPKGAVGVLQVRPETAREVDPTLEDLGDSVIRAELTNHERNVDIGVHYYRLLYYDYATDAFAPYGTPEELVAAAYNGGPEVNELSETCDNTLAWQCETDNEYEEVRQYVADINQLSSFVVAREASDGSETTDDGGSETTDNTDHESAQTEEPTDSSPPDLQATSPEGAPVVVALGDSLTLGTGATDGSNYVDALSRWTGLDIINEGVSGDTVADALARIDTAVLSHDPNIVLVFLGGNDVLQNVPIGDTVLALEELVHTIRTSGVDVILIAGHGTDFLYERESKYRQVAIGEDARYVSNVLQNILGRPELLADAVHPNNEGYRLVAQRIWKELQPALNDYAQSELPLHATCEASPEDVLLGERVEWNAYTWGGPQSFVQISWDGTDALAGGGAKTYKTYSEIGTKSAQLTAISGDEEVARSCLNTVSVTAPPLVGHCEVELDIDFRSDEDLNEVTAEWRAFAAGGTGEYNFSWSGDGPGGNESVSQASYVTSGTKQGTITITSGNEDLQLTCSIQVRGSMMQATSSLPLHGGCSISPSSYSADRNIVWRARASGGGTPRTYLWEDGSDLDSEETANVTVKYKSRGTKEGFVTISDGDTDFEAGCMIQLADQPVSGGRSGGCFIATAAFGSEMQPDVALLRAFRDNTLQKSAFGRWVVRTYYEVSPPIAATIRDSELLKVMTRFLLRPIVETVRLVED